MDTRRVLSIQSHVVSGYVGNKSATFPLQVLGFEVDPINSVQFSNHKGHPICKGQILNADELGELYDGLKGNSLNQYSHLLTGFIGSESFLTKVCDVVRDLKTVNPSLKYVCDPVMGDDGKIYVPKGLLPIYKTQIIPLADIITPNQFETELLTDIKVENEEHAIQAMQKLHDMGAKTVVISSSDLGDDDVLVGYGSTVNNGASTRVRLEMPKFPAHFTGTGDLFAALLLAWMDKHPNDLKCACEKAVSTMQCVLRKTLQKAKELTADETPTIRRMELQLIQSKSEIENPPIIVEARTF